MTDKPANIKIIIPSAVAGALISGGLAVGMRESQVPDFELRIEQARLEGRLDAVESKVSEDRLRAAKQEGKVEAMEDMMVELRARVIELDNKVDDFRDWRNSLGGSP